MLDHVQQWIYGTAAVVDTVLLFAFVERHNRRLVTVWMALLAVAVWSWHTGTFIRFLVDRSVGPLADPVRWASMVMMAAGLLLMTCATLHGSIRLLKQRGFRVASEADARLSLCYLPMLFVMPISQQLYSDPSAPFLNLLENYHLPYAIWLAAVSGFATYALLSSGITSKESSIRWFFRSLAFSMFLIPALTFLFILMWRSGSTWTSYLQPVVGISPLVPVILFGYYVMRFQFLPLVVERTLVYGVVLMGGLLFHQLVWRGAISSIQERYRLDLGIVETVVLLLVVLLYQPLRSRVGEALQSLVDSSFARRNERRQLAVQLAARAGDPLPQLAAWFTDTVQRCFGCETAAFWICDRNGTVIQRAGNSERLDDHQISAVLTVIAEHGNQIVSRYSRVNSDTLELLERIRAGALLKFQHADVTGLFLIGCRPWGQIPSDEDLNALSLLVEQFGVTIQNSQLLALQVAAEHRLLQQEKLSTLGLLAGSLAHEIKNPLSSIKTIARVLAEELGPDSPYGEDLRMIGGEVDRLAASTSELLDVARPCKNDREQLSLEGLLSPTLRLLQHLARQHRAELSVQFPESVITIALDQVSLREIVFNLVSNGLQAAGEGGRVVVTVRNNAESLFLEIVDNGPGFTAEQQSQIFEPFFTTKATGTGLGLYIVSRRVRELGGDVECHSVPRQATTFRVTLPTK